MIQINKPIMGMQEINEVVSVLKSEILTDSSYEGGKQVRDFEREVSSFLGVKHAIAVNSGTAALHCSLLALGIKQGDEVIVPSFTFVATANAVLACGARPVFVDVSDDYNIDPDEIKKEITSKTKAIIPVHLYGYPANMDEINEIASKKGLFVVEDAAESLGAEYRGRQTGTMSDAGCFSFYATKVVTTGEGGIVATNSDEVAEKVRLIRNHGMLEGYDTRVLGFNYRMTELCAAIGKIQMRKIRKFIEKRRRNARRLDEEIGSLRHVLFRQRSSDRTHVYYLYTVELERRRDEVLRELRKRKIGASVYFKIPVHMTPLYSSLGYSGKRLKNTERAAEKVLSLPVHPALLERELDYVASEFKKVVNDML